MVFESMTARRMQFALGSAGCPVKVLALPTRRQKKNNGISQWSTAATGGRDEHGTGKCIAFRQGAVVSKVGFGNVEGSSDGVQ